MEDYSREIDEIQELALQYAEKVQQSVIQNERFIDMMNGGQLYGYKERT